MVKVYPLSNERIVDLIAGGGLNRGMPRLQLAIDQAWTLHNLLPTNAGFSNRHIGFGPQLNQEEGSERGKIQGGFVYQGKHYFVRDGNLYQLPLKGGLPTLLASGKFSPTARVRSCFAMGSGLSKVYLVDGSNDLQSWNGSSLNSVSLPAGFSKPDKLILWRGRLVLGFPKDSADENRLLFSQTEDADEYTQSTGSIIDPFFDYVYPGDGDYINGLATLKVKNAAAQSELLLALKSRQTYQADELALNGSLVEATFHRLAVDLGVINPDCIVNFGNDINVLNYQGIGGFSSATSSGGIDVLTYGLSGAVNPLIHESTKSSAFQNAFAIHLSQQQTILFFLPAGEATAKEQYGFVYPEVPLDQVIGFRYGYSKDTRSGQAYSSWFTLGGEGFAVSAAWCDEQGILYLGTALGNVFQAFAGDTFEEERIIYSTYESGDLSFGAVHQPKCLRELTFHLQVDRQISLDCEILPNGEENGKLYLNKNSSKNNLQALLWGFGKWGETSWGAAYPATIGLRPTGVADTFRLRLQWPSQRQDAGGAYHSNHAVLYGLSGFVEFGSIRD